MHEVETSRPEAQIVVKAVSHEARVNENRYTTRSSTSSGTASALITSLVRGVLGGSWPVLNLLTTDPTFPAGQFDLDGGRWETVEQIADAAGAEAFFDAVGVLVIRPVPVKAAPVLTITGGEGGTLTGYKSTKGWGSNAVGVVYDDGTSRIVGYAEDTVTRLRDVRGRGVRAARPPRRRPGTGGQGALRRGREPRRGVDAAPHDGGRPLRRGPRDPGPVARGGRLRRRRAPRCRAGAAPSVRGAVPALAGST